MPFSAKVESETREIFSCIDMQTHAGGLGLGFDLLTSESVHAKVLPWTICLPTLVLIAQTIFLLECGQTDVTETPYPTPAAMQLAWVIMKPRYTTLRAGQCG